MSAGNLTLDQIRVLHPDFAARIDMTLATSYEDFIKHLHIALDSSIDYLEENPGIRTTDSEDRTTTEIIGNLRERGYDADHDTKINGHVDIFVRHRCGYKWLGEAKKHSSYDWLNKGFQQLCTRYSRGTPKQNQGGLLIYIRTKDAKSVISNWKNYLSANSECNGLHFEESTDRPGLCFYTEHEHDSSGLPYRVRHMGIVLHHDPKA